MSMLAVAKLALCRYVIIISISLEPVGAHQQPQARHPWS